MKKIHRKIEELVGDNLVFAFVLYYFGIKFYDYSEKTLKQVCEERGLNPEIVIKSLESEEKDRLKKNPKLISYPIDLIIEYLKHSHYIFIKKKLPFIARLLENQHDFKNNAGGISDDLKIVFPLFVEDFIQHIYEEEDTLFVYILNLYKAKNKQVNPSKLYFQMEKHSLQNYAVEHEIHEDEMQGLRRITSNYEILSDYNLSLKVIVSELKNFEKELQIHADIENKILFPKAMELEREVKEMMADKIPFN